MSKHKKQHYIPSSYLKAWCDPGCPKNQKPYLWIFSSDGSIVKKKSPENIFHEREMYTIYRADCQRDLVLEHGLRELETSFAKIRRNNLDKKRPLSVKDHILLCAFIAAIHSRTKANRDHWKEQWGLPLKIMEDLNEWAKTATVEEKRQVASIKPVSVRESDKRMTYEQVKELAKTPLQIMLTGMIETYTRLFCKLKMAIFCTIQSPGFITSDSPCVWHDPEAYKRHPSHRSTTLIYPTVEITLPISPNQAILLSHQDLTGYIDVNDLAVDEINRGTRFDAYEYFVVNKNIKNDYWFDPGEEPPDSWEKTHKKDNVEDTY